MSEVIPYPILVQNKSSRPALGVEVLYANRYTKEVDGWVDGNFHYMDDVVIKTLLQNVNYKSLLTCIYAAPFMAKAIEFTYTSLLEEYYSPEVLFFDHDYKRWRFKKSVKENNKYIISDEILINGKTSLNIPLLPENSQVLINIFPSINIKICE